MGAPVRTLRPRRGTIRPVTSRPPRATGPVNRPRSALASSPHTADTPVGALVTAALAGDEGAWAEIVRRHTGLVMARIRQFRLGEHQAEDVAQTVWLNLLEHLGTLREPAALPGWISTTTRHECLRVAAAGRRAIPVDPSTGELDGLADDDEDGLAGELMRSERYEALRAGLDEIPEHQRRLLLLLSTDPPPTYQEISAQLGIPVGSIGPTRQRGLDRLRRSDALRGFVTGNAHTTHGAGGRDVLAW